MDGSIPAIFCGLEGWIGRMAISRMDTLGGSRMVIPVIWLSLTEGTPPTGYWDHGMLEALFNGELWQTPNWPQFNQVQCQGAITMPESDTKGAVVVFPARAQVAKVEELNEALAALEWVVLILTGDEEASFPVEKIKHPRLKLWVMSPRPGRNDNHRKLGTGWPPQIRYHINSAPPWKYLDVFFSGQDTHERRHQLMEQLKAMQERKDMRVEAHGTAGFTKGQHYGLYYGNLQDAKIAPAPSGPETPDTFRLFEALEAGCVPIADALDPKGAFPPHYWTWFFEEEPPFPVVTNYEQMTGYCLEALKNWPAINNKVFAWWQGYKRKLAENMVNDIYYCLAKPKTALALSDKITVIIPSSPMAAHPDTSMIEQTIADVRTQLPDCEIIITLDGVRREQKHYAKDYEEYKRRLLWLTNNRWRNVLPVVFEKHMHQASMAREALKLVRTPLILYVEHDAPPVPDRVIEWEGLVAAIEHGHADMIRLHHEELILPEHEHMMVDTEISYLAPYLVPMRQTMQWSQRPHLARTSFYARILEDYFHPASKTMIEDVMHGVVHTRVSNDVTAWNDFKLWVYMPETDELGIKRSYHLDGRGKDPKYEMIIKPVRRRK